jgi:hypothetical protein
MHDQVHVVSFGTTLRLLRQGTVQQGDPCNEPTPSPIWSIWHENGSLAGSSRQGPPAEINKIFTVKSGIPYLAQADLSWLDGEYLAHLAW